MEFMAIITFKKILEKTSNHKSQKKYIILEYFLLRELVTNEDEKSLRATKSTNHFCTSMFKSRSISPSLLLVQVFNLTLLRTGENLQVQIDKERINHNKATSLFVLSLSRVHQITSF